MHCTKRITDDMIWVGADDRRLALFEGVYGVPDGVSYNSYLILDEKTILFDTVDKAVAHNFFDNVDYALGGRKLDYLVISHMEPDHAATIEDIALRYPDVTIVCNTKIRDMLGRFFPTDLSGRGLLRRAQRPHLRRRVRLHARVPRRGQALLHQYRGQVRLSGAGRAAQGRRA